jgi:hypothetical protein
MKLAFALALLTAAPLSAAAQQGTRGTSAADIVSLLEQSGLKYRKAADRVWAVAFKGGENSSFDVMINEQDRLVIVLAVVVRKPTLSPEQLSRLLRVNYDANYSKVAIDGDGDLLALSELAREGLTVQALRSAIDSVASTARAASNALNAPAGASSGPAAASKDTSATLSLVRGAFQLTYDPRKWTQQKTAEANGVQLNHVSGDAYLRVIAERVQIDSGSLRDVALTNARTTAPDVQLDSETWRTVNGLRALVLKYTGRASGIRFTFLNQMYSDASGTVQLAGWTGSNLFDEYQRDFQELFQGFRKLP